MGQKNKGEKQYYRKKTYKDVHITVSRHRMISNKASKKMDLFRVPLLYIILTIKITKLEIFL